jgi:hypothetical protein
MPATSPLRCGRCLAVAGDLRNAHGANPAQWFVHIRRRKDASKIVKENLLRMYSEFGLKFRGGFLPSYNSCA